MMQKKIKLFGASWCPACVMIKERLEEKKIAFEYIDAGIDPQAVENAGVKSLPTIIVDGLIINNPAISDLRELGVLV